MHERRPRWAWLFFLQLALVIAASALATAGHLPTTVFRSPVDKVGHLLAFGGLSFLGVSYFGCARRWRVMLILLAAATTDELLQAAFPTRTFDLRDLAMNVVGILVFGLARRAAPARAAAGRPRRRSRR
jgi:VanZ family protein